MPACKIVDLAKSMAKAITGREDYPIKNVGIRPGEKIHEVLVSEEEMRRAIETETHYVICPHEDLAQPKLMRNIIEYTSNNTEMLDEEGIISLLSAEGWV
jgi:FlaA1/EpsC-like NDP-sugar epimerase